MKSEERHELQQNDLVSGAAGLYVFIRRYGMIMVLVAALAFLGFELLRLHQANVLRQHQQAWLALRQAQRPAQIRDTVLEVYHFPAVRARAYVKIGAWYLDFINMGSSDSAVKGPKISPGQALAGARKAFQKVVDKYSGVEPLVVTRAKLGLAMVDEDTGQWAKAAAIYKAFLAPEASPMEKSFASLAAYRLRHLKSWARPPLVGPPEKTPSAATEK